MFSSAHSHQIHVQIKYTNKLEINMHHLPKAMQCLFVWQCDNP